MPLKVNLAKKNYIKYLIDRYHELKKTDKNLTEMKYVILYNSIKRKFKAKWDMIHEKQFLELVTFLQERIDKTILGKANNKKGIKNYRDF